MVTTKSIELLAKELENARASHDRAQQQESIARNETTTALNRLNECQRAFDTKVQEIRKSGPIASDWGQERRRGTNVIGPMLVLLCAMLFVGCDNPNFVRPAYQRQIPPESRDRAEAMLVRLCAASNPNSDEEPEDMISEARRAVLEIYGRPVLGALRGREQGIWTFVPRDELPPDLQAVVDAWARGSGP